MAIFPGEPEFANFPSFILKLCIIFGQGQPRDILHDVVPPGLPQIPSTSIIQHFTQLASYLLDSDMVLAGLRQYCSNRSNYWQTLSLPFFQFKNHTFI